MKIFDRIKSLNPLAAIDHKIQESVEDKTRAAVRSAVAEFAHISPEVADLIAGEQVRLEITVTLQLKQKGES